jgi:uncharacterized protein YebE (UPF0316 family)
MVWIMIGNALLIFCLRMIGVAMGTVRMILIGRCQRIIAPLLGFVESTIWVFAISQVITNLDNIYNILGFSGGFAAGTLVGMLIENKLALGFVGINVVSMNHGSEIVEKLRQADYGVTELYGSGQSGAVIMINTIVSRKDIKAVFKLVNRIDPQCFIAVDDMAVVKRGYMHFAQ